MESPSDDSRGSPAEEPIKPWNPDPGRWIYRSTQDSICFGGHDGEGYAVEGGIWDFEEGTVQGWTDADDPQGSPWWKRMGPADYECPDEAPMIGGTGGQLWIGDQQTQADVECWDCDAGLSCSLGYINGLLQRAESPGIDYAGGTIDLAFE
ncbi:MAG: hypothetical protein GF355_00050 [Candidatus Eisenbacteria bacterium]|nr:hypothetical protein [Candidatus Eisenbacteria bacterium]